MKCLALAVALVVAACAGGGGSTPAPTPPTPRTEPALVCYFGSNAAAATLSLDHTNCVEAADFYGPVEQMATLMQAGTRKVILDLPACRDGLPVDQVEGELTFWLQRLQDGGHFAPQFGDRIAAVRLCDEPDDKGMSDAEVKARITAAHAAMAKFTATRAKPVTLYYVCSSGKRPGIDYVDWPGCDRYDAGCEVFARFYGEFEGIVNANPDRRIAAILSGVEQWPTPPACMVDKLRRDGRYALGQGFIAQTVGDRGNTYVGILERADVAAQWRAAYRSIL